MGVFKVKLYKVSQGIADSTFKVKQGRVNRLFLTSRGNVDSFCKQAKRREQELARKAKL